MQSSACEQLQQQRKEEKKKQSGYISEILSDFLFLHQDFFFYQNTADKQGGLNKSVTQQFGVIKKSHI